MLDRLLILGCGYAGTAIARLGRERGLAVRVTVRSDERARALRAEGFDVLQSSAIPTSLGAQVGESTHVIVAFPPRGDTDARLAPAFAGAGAVTYLSARGVEEATSGALAPSRALVPSGELATSGALATSEELATSEVLASSGALATSEELATSEVLASSGALATSEELATSEVLATSGVLATSEVLASSGVLASRAAAAKRLAAERAWRSIGATVLRCPTLHGGDVPCSARGPTVAGSVSGPRRAPRAGDRCRIHVDELARLVLAPGRTPGETRVVGDAEPEPRRARGVRARGSRTTGARSSGVREGGHRAR